MVNWLDKFPDSSSSFCNDHMVDKMLGTGDKDAFSMAHPFMQSKPSTLQWLNSLLHNGVQMIAS